MAMENIEEKKPFWKNWIIWVLIGLFGVGIFSKDSSNAPEYNPYVPTPIIVTRPINSTTYTISTTKQAFVDYNIVISCTATIGSASNGSVALQYSTNAGSTWTTVGTVSNSNTVSLAIALNSVQASGIQLSGYIPANALVRMVQTIVGTTTISYSTGQETN